MSVLQHLLSLPFLVQSKCIPSQCCFELLVTPALYPHNSNHESERFLASLVPESLKLRFTTMGTSWAQCHIIPFNDISNMNRNRSICTYTILLHQTNQFTLCQISFLSLHSHYFYLELMSNLLYSHICRFPEFLPISAIPQIQYFLEFQSNRTRWIFIIFLFLITTI